MGTLLPTSTSGLSRPPRPPSVGDGRPPLLSGFRSVSSDRDFLVSSPDFPTDDVTVVTEVGPTPILPTRRRPCVPYDCLSVCFSLTVPLGRRVPRRGQKDGDGSLHTHNGTLAPRFDLGFVFVRHEWSRGRYSSCSNSYFSTRRPDLRRARGR